VVSGRLNDAKELTTLLSLVLSLSFSLEWEEVAPGASVPVPVPLLELVLRTLVNASFLPRKEYAIQPIGRKLMAGGNKS